MAIVESTAYEAPGEPGSPVEPRGRHENHGKLERLRRNPAPHLLTTLAALGLALLLVALLADPTQGPAIYPVPLPRIHVRGRRLYAGGAPWRAWGMNWGLDGRTPVLAYLDKPTPARLAVLASQLQIAHRLGANSMRIPVELGQVMQSPIRARSSTLAALKKLLAVAERDRIYLDITGNVVWRPQRVPAWYERMSERSRWQVQANFWRAVAHTAAASPAVLCYELTSEPIVGDTPGHYTGKLGNWYFVQRIGTLHRGSGRAVARAWTKKLAAAVRSQDNRPVTIGLLPSLHDSFVPANVADLLDMLTVHEYPKTGNAGSSVALVKDFAGYKKPVLLGETFPIAGDLDAERSFLLGANPYLVGAFEFFDGRDPNRMKVSTISDAIYQTALRQFIALRRALLKAR